MKTTVEISDPLFNAAREHCATNGLTFRQLVEAGLRAVVEQPLQAEPFRLKAFGFQGDGQLINDWAEIREVLYAGGAGVIDETSK